MKHLYKEFVKFPAAKTLNEGQLKFAKVFFSGANTMLSGGAGVGKSFVIKVLFDFLHKEGVSLGKVASTGVAALGIGGSTLHSWTGIGLGNEPANNLLNEVLRNKKARDRIARTKILFIDEVSMLGGDLLNKLNFIFKYVRNNDGPFGGIQIVTVTDFCQLLPVFRGSANDILAFESEAWKELNLKCVILTKLMRQDETSKFAEALNLIRFGDTSMLHVINSRIDAKFPDDGIHPVRIFCKNIDVDKFNNDKLKAIDSNEEEFRAIDSGPPYISDYFDKNCLAPKILKLKVGAVVMLLRNIDVENGYVNGSIGIIEGFTPEGPKVRFTNGTSIISREAWELKEQQALEGGKIEFKVLGSRTQVPLKLSWASTVHKCQGTTLDRVEIDLNEAFCAGMSYVGLSRCRNLESLSIKKFSPSRIFADERCINFYKSIKDPVIEDFKEEEAITNKYSNPKESSSPKKDDKYSDIDL